MVEWLIEHKNILMGAAAVALPIAVIDWLLRNRKQTMLQQQKNSPNSKPKKKKGR